MKRIIAVLFSVAALLLPVADATAHASTLGPQQFVNYNSGKCAGLYGTSLSDNAVFTQYTCGFAGFNQNWYLIENFSGSGGMWYQLQNAYSGKCAMPINFSKTVGADIVQVTCTPPASSSSSCSSSCSAQLWRIETSPYSSYGYNYFYNRYSNQCLNAKDGSTLNGVHIVQTNCGSSHLSDLWFIAG
ncbi:MAG: RICIN domain-containing protein [Frankiaceae bacterium]